jgi:2-dehydro-3-deoxyglucarate aldolase/4-hydroxy-2-oxoheptanedioate aldolase
MLEQKMKQSLLTRLKAGDLLIGTILTLPSPEVAEMMSSCGFDWLFVDLEHGALDFAGAQTILMGASPSTACAVRVPANDEGWTKKCLDLGADGIIIPHIQTKEDAERAVRLCRYPPLGERSAGIGRAQGYGLNFQNYIQEANDTVALIIQIEHIDALPHIESIVQVDGIDAIFIGPYDFSGSMGKMGNVKDPDLLKAIARVRDCCRDAGLPLGIFGATVDSVKPYIREGYRLIAVGADTLLLGEAAKQIVDTLGD